MKRAILNGRVFVSESRRRFGGRSLRWSVDVSPPPNAPEYPQGYGVHGKGEHPGTEQRNQLRYPLVGEHTEQP